MVKKNLPSIEYLDECLTYIPETGQLMWKQRPRSHFVSDNAMMRWNAKHANKEAGCKKPIGYTLLSLSKKRFVAHRICWVLAGREIPPREMHIDHINGDPHDNRLCNLRVSTYSENNANQRMKRNNTSGFKGVSLRKDTNKWDARISFNGKQYILGSYDTKGLAALAYMKASMRLHGQFSRSI